MRCLRCHGRKWNYCLGCYGSGIVSCCDTAGENYGKEVDTTGSEGDGEERDSGEFAQSIGCAREQENTRGENGGSETQSPRLKEKDTVC